MSSSDRVCSDCNTPVDDRGCPNCWWKTPVPRIIKRTHWTLAKGAGYTGGPVVRLVGSASFYDATQATTTLTIPNVRANAGEALYIVTAKNSCEFPNTTETWGSLGVTPGDTYSWGSPAFHTASNIDVTISGVHDIVLAINPLQLVPNPISCVAIALTVSKVIAPRSYDSGLHSSFGNSAGSANPTTTTTRSPSQASVMSIAALAINGPSTDDAGAWTNNFAPLLRLGTNGGGTDCTLAIATKLINSTSAITAGVNGITSRPWALAAQPIKTVSP